MKKKPLKRKNGGWVYFVQWASSPSMVKIGYSSSPRERFASFLTSSPDTLVVIKIFEGDQEDEKLLHERFASCRERREWFRLSPLLKRYLEEEAVCQTLEAKVQFGRGMEDDVKWMPLRPNTAALLAAMQQEKRLPLFVKNARLYTLWAISDLDAADYFVTSNAIIKHEANDFVFQAKTIYNQLAMLEEEGLIQKDKAKTFTLTEEGITLLANAEAEFAATRKKSARSLKIR